MHLRFWCRDGLYDNFSRANASHGSFGLSKSGEPGLPEYEHGATPCSTLGKIVPTTGGVPLPFLSCTL